MTKAEAIDKIRKLRRLAGDIGATSPEAQTARRIARELTEQHGITAAELEPRPAEGAAGAGPIVDWGVGNFSFYVDDNVKVHAGPLDFDGSLEDFLRFLYNKVQGAGAGMPSSAAGVKRARPATAEVIRDHQAHPSRVHMAINSLRSVCGVGPTFVWTFERQIAIRSGEPCPHCMETGVIDARKPTLRLAPNRLRDARGRWV